MKKILITGANSYVGTNVEKWLIKEPDKYYVETLDMKDPNWKEFDFSKFDVVFHVAGIAHVSAKKSMKEVYFKINRDLTIETAMKAKEAGVKQFIFMSSMIVYNSREKNITLTTKTEPNNFYGLSKLQAEEGIFQLESKSFNVCVLRPPMIYGPNSKGNFHLLAKNAKKFFILPKLKNERSILYIDNLLLCVKNCIDDDRKGLFFPRNTRSVSTNEIIFLVRNAIGKKNRESIMLGFVVKVLKSFIAFLNKMYGDRIYDDTVPNILNDMIIKCTFIDFEESVVNSIE